MRGPAAAGELGPGPVRPPPPSQPRSWRPHDISRRSGGFNSPGQEENLAETPPSGVGESPPWHLRKLFWPGRGHGYPIARRATAHHTIPGANLQKLTSEPLRCLRLRPSPEALPRRPSSSSADARRVRGRPPDCRRLRPLPPRRGFPARWPQRWVPSSLQLPSPRNS